MADVRQGLELLAAELESTSVDGRTYWFAPADPPPTMARPMAHLLQAYDEFVIAYSQSRDLLDLAGLYAAAAPIETLTLHAVIIRRPGRWPMATGGDSPRGDDRRAARSRAQLRRVRRAYGRRRALRPIPRPADDPGRPH